MDFLLLWATSLASTQKFCAAYFCLSQLREQGLDRRNNKKVWEVKSSKWMRVQAGFHVSFKLLHCLLLLDSVQFSSSSCCSATVLCLILQSPLMLISFFWSSHRCKNYFGDMWFDSLLRRARFFSLTNKIAFLLNHINLLNFFLLCFQNPQIFPFYGLASGGQHSPCKAQCHNQINFQSGNCTMKAFVFSAVVCLWDGGSRDVCPLAKLHPSASPGAWYHSFPLQQGWLTTLLTQDEVLWCCPAPRSQSNNSQKHGKSHHLWADSLGK